MTREEKINYIKDILSDKSISTSELELDSSPIVNTMCNGNIYELIENFNSIYVETAIYHNHIQIDWCVYKYTELSDELIDEITEIMTEHKNK
jgi:hypothetical protein